ncbi:alpha/beta-hydrolase [Dacryopinax primogenitus]|uniref:Alpha/beta-hydrolase n=1 Tax=Dacryopinax primogenitus (strain DJM 731) TaxID=1858805 RepID=M5FT65_DACPD|nr:alpha/beta-hydrolase [Dacryopinax primogenitus]EJU00786.1 alpha/beta-hydrolase [Dacryopinax primogenitus]
MMLVFSALLVFLLAAIAQCMYMPISSNPRTVTTITPLGPAIGTVTAAGAVKYVVRYASTPMRWGAPVVEKVFLAANISDPSALPPVCPQNGYSPGQYSEDCLFMVLYVPPNTRPSASLPMLMWVHGGTNIMGSASNPGLDGSNLAIATQSIVAVVQYRLGVLGFVPPSTVGAVTNPALRDLIAALQFLHTIGPSLGGSTARVTLAGQSSGAGLIRALLGTPSASQYFTRAWLHSDPMNYGLLPPASLVPYQQVTYANISSPLTASVDDLLATYDNALNDLEQPFDLAGLEGPRPVVDGQLVQYWMQPFSTSYAPASQLLPNNLKALVLTTTSAEAGPADYADPAFAQPLPYVAFLPILESVLGEPRAGAVANSSYYADPSAANDPTGGDIRNLSVKVGTDQVWRCSNYAFARAYSARGAKVYPPAVASFCTDTSSTVCHEDDIYPVFGTTPSANGAQNALTREVQQRYAQWLLNGVPGGDWRGVQGNDVSARILGGPQDAGVVAAGACDPAFWGQSVNFDYQVFTS